MQQWALYIYICAWTLRHNEIRPQPPSSFYHVKTNNFVAWSWTRSSTCCPVLHNIGLRIQPKLSGRTRWCRFGFCRRKTNSKSLSQISKDIISFWSFSFCILHKSSRKGFKGGTHTAKRLQTSDRGVAAGGLVHVCHL